MGGERFEAFDFQDQYGICYTATIPEVDHFGEKGEGRGVAVIFLRLPTDPWDTPVSPAILVTYHSTQRDNAGPVEVAFNGFMHLVRQPPDTISPHLHAERVEKQEWCID